jgi:hypothetical protein
MILVDGLRRVGPNSNERSAPNQRRIDSKRLADLDQTLVQRMQTGAMM